MPHSSSRRFWLGAFVILTLFGFGSHEWSKRSRMLKELQETNVTLTGRLKQETKGREASVAELQREIAELKRQNWKFRAADPTPPAKIGDELFSQLSESEFAQLNRLVTTNGEIPWLLMGIHDQLFDVVEAYFPPAHQSTELRRGKVLHVERLRSERGPPWELRKPAEYGQVRLEGRDPERVLSLDDINRPFMLVGGPFDDDDLIAIVKLIRTSPKVKGDKPITMIQRRADGSIQLNLWNDSTSGQLVTVRKENGAWVIEKTGGWIA